MKVAMKKYILSLLVLSIALSGCEDFLSKVPDNRTILDSKEKIAELLVTAYPEGNYIPFCEAMSDNVEDNPSQSQDVRNTDPYFWRNVNSTAQDTPENYWNSCYTAIAAANHALQAIEREGNLPVYDAQRGEALVARAYAHFMLVALFAKTYKAATAAYYPGIPYVTEPETESLKKYDRHTVEYVYTMIEKDLTDGLPLIDDQSYNTEDADADGVPSYHFTRAAAHAFATRFYLFKRDYNKVIEHANQVFTNTDIAASLRPWNSTYRGYAMNELITTYTRSTEKANLLLSETLSDWAFTYNTLKYTTGVNTKAAVLDYNATQGQYSYWVYYSSVSQVYFVPKFKDHFVRTGTNANTGFTYTVIPLFSAEEVLLNRAEAYTMQNNLSAALDDMNILVSKRITNYVPEYHNLNAHKLYNFYQESINQEATLLAVLDLRRAEFLHEGLRWFDILRHDLPVEHLIRDGESIILSAGDPRRVLQIPAEAISLGGLEPNPR
jgi:hypothetical protein